MPEEKIRKILKISKEPISMETPIGDDDDSHLGDFIEDQSTLAPNDAAMYASLRDVTKEVLDTLTPREAKVLRMRFGIEMNTDHTLEEVGKQFDVTRERIRQIEAKALRKLRHPVALGAAEELPRSGRLIRGGRMEKGPRKRPFCFGGKLAARAGSSAGQSRGLIIPWSLVRFQPGPLSHAGGHGFTLRALSRNAVICPAISLNSSTLP